MHVRFKVETSGKDRRVRRGGVRNRGTKDKPLWYCRYTDIDGRRREAATDQPTRAAAEQFLAAVKARIARGLVGIPVATVEEKARSSVTVAQLVARFLGDVEGEPGYAPPRIKDLEGYRVQARSVLEVRVLPTFGLRAAASVRRMDIERWRDKLAEDDYSASSVTHALASFSKLYVWARGVDLIACANPVQGVERPRVTSTLDYLDASEAGRLLAKAEEMAAAEGANHEARVRHPMVATALYAGLRKGELFGLRWRDVHLDAARLDVMRSYRFSPKSGKARHLPLNAALVPILRSWRKRCPETKEGLVFPVELVRPRLDPETREEVRFEMGTGNDLVGLSDAVTAAECHLPADGRAWHLLRHSFASHFMMAGGNILTLQKLLGHASLDMTLIYAHLAPDHVAAEVARLAYPPPSRAAVIDLAGARAGRGAEQEASEY